MNKLYFGDNLHIMRDHIASESVDLIYLDPPFNSKANYNVLFKEQNGTASPSQITAFVDTWHWGRESEEVYMDLITSGTTKLSSLIQTFRSFLGTNDMMAYLTMIAIRLVEMHRVLKLTGSIYLHCDPTASHYLKLVLDAIFGANNYRNEIVWCYKSRPQSKKYFGKKHDTIFFYSISDNYTFNWSKVVRALTDSSIKKYKHIDEDGRLYRLQGRGITNSPIRSAKDVDPKWEITNPDLVVRDYLDEKIGVSQEDWWTDINIINQAAAERLGYPTQKPESLLERIIQASSNEGDVVMDPFCGCGTTIAIAERLQRKWIGIDMTHLAITLIRHRLKDTYGINLRPYEVIGDPKDLESARALAEHDRYQFQYWAFGKVAARPLQQFEKKKGADKGIDGVIYFLDDNTTGIAKKIIVQVKSGNIKRSDIATLNSDRQRENAEIGAFITLQNPTRPMLEEAIGVGFYEPINFPGTHYPRIQIITIEELLRGMSVEYPRVAPVATFTRARKKLTKDGEQGKLEL